MSDCWETFASSRAALHFYRELAPKSGRLNIQELLRLAEDGDKTAEKAILGQAKALGRWLRLITAALSPELILIAGEITSCWK
jgi:predicted NBD/HSP70 family sugar kinase